MKPISINYPVNPVNWHLFGIHLAILVKIRRVVFDDRRCMCEPKAQSDVDGQQVVQIVETTMKPILKILRRDTPQPNFF